MKGEGGVMSTILRRIRLVTVQYNFILYVYIGLANQHDKGGETQSTPLQTAIDTEQFRKLQESESQVPT